MANGREREGVLIEGRNFVAFQADFGDVLVGDHTGAGLRSQIVISTRPIIRLGRKKDFWLLAREVQQTQRCAGGFALALFPTAFSCQGNVEERREDRLADIKLFADTYDFLRA